MRTTRYAVRALALSLSLTAVGTFGVLGATSGTPAFANPSAVHSAGGLRADDPVGGAQLDAPGVIVNLGPGVPAPPKMPGPSFVVADLDTGEILAARAPHKRHLPASTLKALTALTLIPRIHASSKIVVQAEDTHVDGTHVGIVAGASYTAHTLFQGLLMNSGNDAAWALARANKSVAVTLDEMNATASELGAHDTVAKDPSGLDAPGQSSSAYDLALIGRAAMKLPDFRNYVVTRSALVPSTKSSSGKTQQGFTISNHNKLIYNYDGAIGIKNGYTIAAKQTIIGAATRGSKSYIVTEMASEDGSWRRTAALLDWAFANGGAVTPIGTLVEPGTAAKPQQAWSTEDTPLPTSTPPDMDTTTPTGSPVAPHSALGRPKQSTEPSVLRPWMGVAGLILAMGLGGALATHNISRKRRRL